MKALSSLRILVIADEHSAPAVKQAVRLAKAARPYVKFVDVVYDPPIYRQIAIPSYTELAGIARNQKRKRLNSLARRLQVQSLNVEVALLEGPEESTIVRQVCEGKFDCVLLTPEPSARERDLGPIATRLLRKCPCSIWVVRKAPYRRRPRIVAAVDADGNPALNKQVLALASSVSKALGGQLHLLHAWRAFGEGVFSQSTFGGMSKAQLEHYVDDIRKRHAAGLRTLTNQCGVELPPEQIHLLKGDARAVIPEYCNSNKVDLLVAGMAGREGVSALMIGNTVEVVAEQLGCSVLAVRSRTQEEAEEATSPQTEQTVSQP
jgi:nucleotide-binding universal stress UspA family protein